MKTQVETQRQSHWHFTSLDSTSIFIMYIIYRICFTNKQVRFWRWMGIMLFGQWTLHCSIISQCSLDCRGPSSLTNCLASLAPLPVTWMRTEMWLLSHTKKKLCPLTNSDNYATKLGGKQSSSGCDFHIGIKMALQGGTWDQILK